LTGSRDLRFKFWDPLYISEMVGAINFKFGMPGALTKESEVRSKGVVRVSREGVK